MDRLFARFSDTISKAYFIGSPPSLQNLLSICCPDRVFYHHQVLTVYDWKEFLKPFINNNIKYYQVPHNFRLFRIYNKCVFQYKLYSEHKIWLPITPLKIDKQLEILEECIVKIPAYFSVGSKEELLKNFGITASINPSNLLSGMIVDEIDILASVRDLSEVFADLEGIYYVYHNIFIYYKFLSQYNYSFLITIN